MSEQQNRAEVLARKLKSHAIRWSDIDEAANLLRSQARALALLWEVVEILQYQPEQPNSPPSCPACDCKHFRPAGSINLYGVEFPVVTCTRCGRMIRLKLEMEVEKKDE